MEKSGLQFGEYYHIYNRGNNKEILFRERKNYDYFMSLYLKYIDPIAETLAYCLMPNHVHFVVRIKDENDIKSFEELNLFQRKAIILIDHKKPTPSNQFSHLFNAYSKAINTDYKRTGSLFEHPFERRLIDNFHYLQRCIAYVHYNPIEAGLVYNMKDYRWSSFKALFSSSITHMSSDLVMKVFEDKEYFLAFHGTRMDEFKSLEDDYLQHKP